MFQSKNALRGLFVATAALAAFAVTASAAGAATLSLGTPSLTSRVAITEPVTVTCSPFDPSLTLFSENITVQVQQAAGRAIARASGGQFGFLPNLLFPCDGTPTTIPVTMSADPTGPPFHGGPAVFTVSVGAGAGTPCFPGSTTCFTSPTAGQSAAAGPTALNLR